MDQRWRMVVVNSGVPSVFQWMCPTLSDARKTVQDPCPWREDDARVITSKSRGWWGFSLLYVRVGRARVYISMEGDGWKEVNSMSTDLFLLPVEAHLGNRSGQRDQKSYSVRDLPAKWDFFEEKGYILCTWQQKLSFFLYAAIIVARGAFVFNFELGLFKENYDMEETGKLWKWGGSKFQFHFI